MVTLILYTGVDPSMEALGHTGIESHRRKTTGGGCMYVYHTNVSGGFHGTIYGRESTYGGLTGRVSG